MRDHYIHVRDLCISNKEIDVREFSVQRRNNLAHGLGGTSRRGDDIVVDAASTTPIFVRGAVDGLLGSSGGMDGAH